MQNNLPKTVVALRKPRTTDGPDIWNLVRETKILDLNSPYAYLLLGEHFTETCIVAEKGDEIVGFVSAYLPPEDPGVLFIWQVGVAKSMRKQGLALKMLLALLRRDACEGINSLRTTITPSNQPSQALFAALSQAVHGKMTHLPDYFGSDCFPDDQHEAESLYSIAPIRLD